METALAHALALKRFRSLVQTGRLGERREAVGLSQGDLARAIGVNPSTVTKFIARPPAITGLVVAADEATDGRASSDAST